jgi:hypothetical protein
MKHFREPARRLLEAGAALQVDKAGIQQTLAGLLKDKDRAKAMGQAGIKVCKDHEGASARLQSLIGKLLLIRDWKGEARDWRIQSHSLGLKSQEFGNLPKKSGMQAGDH